MCNKTSSILKQHLHQSPLENHNPSRNQNPSCKHLSKSSIFFHLQLHFCLFERSHVLTPSSEIFRAIVLFRNLPVKGQTPGREKTWWRMKTRRFQNHRFVFTSSRKKQTGHLVHPELDNPMSEHLDPQDWDQTCIGHTQSYSQNRKHFAMPNFLLEFVVH